jgi:hypothetical protein
MGKGLRQQIKDGDNIVKYTPLSPELLRLHMDEIWVKPGYRADLMRMFEKNQVTQTEYESLLKMINSPDNENLELANQIMQLKKPKDDADPIYSRRS